MWNGCIPDSCDYRDISRKSFHCYVTQDAAGMTIMWNGCIPDSCDYRDISRKSFYCYVTQDAAGMTIMWNGFIPESCDYICISVKSFHCYTRCCWHDNNVKWMHSWLLWLQRYLSEIISLLRYTKFFILRPGIFPVCNSDKISDYSFFSSAYLFNFSSCCKIHFTFSFLGRDYFSNFWHNFFCASHLVGYNLIFTFMVIVLIHCFSVFSGRFWLVFQSGGWSEKFSA